MTNTSKSKNPQAAVSQVKIGIRLKHARKVKGLRLHQLAEQVGCSESFISKIENNKINPSLQMLHRIVTSLDLTIDGIFSQDSKEDKIVMRSGDRPVINMIPSQKTEGTSLEWLMPPSDNRLLSGGIHVINPGGSSLGTIEHEGEEIGYLLEGEIELEVDGKIYNLKEGDSFFFRSDLPHGYRNMGDRVTRIIWVNTPPTF